MRVVHYLNQFFGGLGGEEKANSPLETKDGPIGPGKLLEELLGSDASVVTTLICGDNYAVERQAEMIDAALNKIRQANADLFVAGPCFLAGRYGMAAGALCSEVQSKLSLPVITGMAE
ncbi:MAG TPA: glycine/betaine/sarcosine/D-proline family reductase selenoprotein B, partial [Candidatus Binatia bacterium]